MWTPTRPDTRHGIKSVKNILLILSLSLCLISVCNSSRDDLEINILDFASQFFKAIQNDDKNQVISPLAMHSSLSLLLSGLEDPCEAAEKLGKLLGYKDGPEELKVAHKDYRKLIKDLKKIDDKEAMVKFSHQIVLGQDSDVERKFNKLAEKYFDVEEHRFAKRDRDDIKKFTKKLNKEASDYGFKSGVIDEDEMVQSNDGIFLLSSIFFSSDWQEVKFDDTDKAQFYNRGHDKVQVDALKSKKHTNVKVVQFGSDKMKNCGKCTSAQKPSSSIPDFRMIQVKLNDKFTYTIIEPSDTGAKALDHLENELLKTSTREGHLVKALNKLDGSDDQEIDYLIMPGYRVEQHTNVRDTLVNKFGLSSLTQGNHITGLVNDQKLNLVMCKSGAVVCVEKDGAEGAGLSQMAPNNCKIKIEHPFMFIIRYDKIPLYMGHVVRVSN